MFCSELNHNVKNVGSETHSQKYNSDFNKKKLTFHLKRKKNTNSSSLATIRESDTRIAILVQFQKRNL